MPVTLTHALRYFCSLMSTSSNRLEVGDHMVVTSPDGKTATLPVDHVNGQFVWVGPHRFHVRDDAARASGTWMLRGFKFVVVK